MVRDAQRYPPMTEPETLAIEDGTPSTRTLGEVRALDAFVRAHHQRLVRLAGLVTRDLDQAQDAVQASLERAWRKRARMRDPASVRPWLDRIVVREAIRLTSRGRLALLRRPLSTDWTTTASSLPGPAEVAIVRDVVGRLSPKHRAVIALHLHAGYSVDETARILGVPVDTVRSRLRAARERVRAEFRGSRG